MPINRNPHQRATKIRVERQKRRNEIAKILEKYKQEVETRCKIHQLGVGYKIQDAKLSEEIGVLAFVEKKLTKEQLQYKQIEPIEKIITEVVTDVVEFQYGIHPTSGIIKYEKINGGMPARHNNKPGSGTLGIVVKRVRKPKAMNGSSGTEFLEIVKSNAEEYLKDPKFYLEFVKNIQFWMLEGKIKSPTIHSSVSSIVENPNELRKIVIDWTEGTKTDAEFLIGLQKLISNGTVKLPSLPEYLYALTNYHVGATESLVGASSPTKKGDAWTFPGFSGYEISPSKGAVAKFVEGKPILPSGQNNFNYYDAALAKISDEWKNYVSAYEIIEIGKVKGMEDAEIGDQVMKWGKSSNLTEGIVAGVVPYPQKITINYNGIYCDFTDQLIIVGNPASKHFSEPGDSGSLVVSKETGSSGAHAALALLFSGDIASNRIYYAFANPIKRIAEDFQLDFD